MDDDLKAPIAELERLAKDATPGPWEQREIPGSKSWGVDACRSKVCYTTPGTYRTESAARHRADTAFIAAANPSTILALLSERRKMVEALTRQTDNMAFVLNRVELPPAWLEKFDRELDEARAALTGSREHG